MTTNTDITVKSDNLEAEILARTDANRLQRKVQRLERAGQWDAAEALTSAWESADAEAHTWGECYLATREL
jgi:hypothetical protein